MVSLFAASDVRGFALTPAGKTAGPSLTVTVVTDVTAAGTQRGLTSIRVQKGSKSAAVLFVSDYVSTLKNGGSDQTCAFNDSQSFPAVTDFRFAGCAGGCLMNGWVDDPVSLQALLGQFGDPNKAAVVDTDYAACTTAGGRQILSFTAVIQFQP
jgi:hypothetical protein